MGLKFPIIFIRFNFFWSTWFKIWILDPSDPLRVQKLSFGRLRLFHIKGVKLSLMLNQMLFMCVYVSNDFKKSFTCYITSLKT